MNKKCEFSVLMSIYNKENPKYFKEALDSILINQSVIPNEIVLVKDGPLTRELDNIIYEYSLKFVDVFNIIELSKNMGLGKALYVGIKECKYDLVARMDTDDISRYDRFEKQLKEFELDRELDIIGSHIIEFETDINKVFSKRIMPTSNESIYKYARRRNPFNHVTVMFKKDSVISSGNYEDMNGIGFEDYLLWVKMLLKKCNCKNIDKSLVFVRIGEGMFERRGGAKYLLNALKFRNRIYKMGFASLSDTLVCYITNIIVSLSPNWLRRFIYLKYLRG